MNNPNQIKKVLILGALIALPFLGQAQSIKVEGSNVKIKTGGTVIETKNGSTKISTNATTQSAKASAKAGVKNIAGSNLKQEITCNGDDVIIIGSENTITILGYVKSLKITGSDNNVKMDKVISISTIGNENQIVYKTSPNKNGKAMVSTTGSDNEISKR